MILQSWGACGLNLRLIVSLRTKLRVCLDMEQRSISLNMDLTKFLQTCLRYSIYSWDSVIKNSGNSKQYWGSCCSKHGHQGDLFEHVVVADQDEVDHHVFVVVYMHQKL